MKKIMLILILFLILIFPDVTKSHPADNIAVMGEFGLGNVVSLHITYKFWGFYGGLGIGYLFYENKDNDTSINIIEPGIIMMKPINMFLLRIRAGMDFVREEKYGLKARATTITPDFLIQWKGIYTGIGLPVTIGKEGIGTGFSIGTGYMLLANVFWGGKGENIYEKSGIKKEVEKKGWASKAPAGVSASDGTSANKIQITWNRLPGAEKYYVYRSTSPGGTYSEIGDTTSIFYNDTATSSGIVYYYKVRAYSKSFGYTGYSDYDSGYPGLSAPGGVSASDGAYTNKVVITWNNVTGAEKYYIYRSTSTNGIYTEIGNTIATSYDDIPPFSIFDYYYKIRAYSSSAGYSEYSDCDKGWYGLLLQAYTGAFELNLFKEIIGNELNTNIFISPLSIKYALAMAYNGAAGETRDAMANVLCFQDKDINAINQLFRENLIHFNSFSPANDKVELSVANSLWINNSYVFKQDFLDINQTYYDAKLAPLTSAEEINTWVKEKTKGKIDKIVGSVDPLTVSIIVNAIYFYGEWQKKFKPENTYNGSFHLLDGSSNECRLMSLEENFNYYAGDNFKAVELPYGDSGISIYIFLPNENTGIHDFHNNLTWGNWTNWISGFSSARVNLRLPKFQMEYDITLNNILSNLGMGVAFDSYCANFTNIAIPPPGQNFWIDKVNHKTFIAVDEEGTEAAAATGIVFVTSSIPPPAVDFIVDHPFFFVIRDNQAEELLFMGSIVNPEYKNENPEFPSNIFCSVTNQTNINIQWTDNSTNETGFNIYINTSFSKSDTPITNLPANFTQYIIGENTIEQITGGQTYFTVWIEAFNDKGSSANFSFCSCGSNGFIIVPFQ